MSSAKVKLRIEAPPRIKMMKTTRKVEKVVCTVRALALIHI